MPMTVVEFVSTGRFEGQFPEVPFAADVNIDELKALDADPMFVTLPVVPKIGAVSKNGLVYDEKLAEAIVAQIHQTKPGGHFGHLKDEDRDSAFPIPEGQWLGAMREGDTVWAKAYIPPGAARQHIRQLKATGGSIATSIYGRGSVKTEGDKKFLDDFELEALDFAPPSRAALGYSAMPHLTSEFEQEKDMPEVITAENVPEDVRSQIIEEFESPRIARISELETELEQTRTEIQELTSKVEAFEAKERNRIIDVIIGETIDWQAQSDSGKEKIRSIKELARERLIVKMADAEDRSEEKVREIFQEVWTALLPIAEAVRTSLAGPATSPGKREDNNGSGFKDTPEARAAARARLGI